MRDFVKLLVVGIILFLTPVANAEEYKLLVLPDNIVTENIAIDSYIYNATSEFFADDIITLLNTTDYITAPTVSETRNTLKQDVASYNIAKNFTNKLRTSYNIDYVGLKKIATKTNSRYVLAMTSFVDAENYILRRTLWDFLNIPGATVIDPAYKISTYAVLIDTENNSKLWSDTYYKTISVCESRIITRGQSPQVEQLQKIKDYSKYITPQIAQNVQKNMLPPSVFIKESKRVEFGIKDIDNVFTKKYRHLHREYGKVYDETKANYNEFVQDTKTKIDYAKEKQRAKQQQKELKKQEELQSKLEVKATPVLEDNLNEINNKINTTEENIKNTVYKKQTNDIQYPELINIEIKKKKKNNLFGDYQVDRPELRNYN